MSSNMTSPAFKTLNIFFDVDALKDDLKKIEASDWVDHVNKRAYRGSWNVFPLRCSAEHVDAHPILQSFSIETGEQWENLPILDQCPAFGSILTTLESQHCKIYAVRLMRLHAGAEIAEHRDHGLGADNGEVRLHVPIITNEEVEFIVDGKKASMKEGELWYIDADRPHSVANRGVCDRIHLVIDGAINDWLLGQLE